ncbi:MAG: teicoplanin resistance protein VanZ [Elusimicrobia bacterium CG11_big_fil_rev_8_21_14_0_20_64_6]|nr:MAG: teicoplanin resistance protein VanZ [Elusimicrobia bacterium CG11_big_fil_rev_8_21_14_0_20_64_6]
MKRKLNLWGPVVAWCAVIFALSAVPDLNSGLSYDFPLRKAAHMAEYAILWALARRAMGDGWGLVFSVLYAMSDEYHQSFVGGRHGAWTDVLIDSAGALLALTSVRLRAILRHGS